MDASPDILMMNTTRPPEPRNDIPTRIMEMMVQIIHKSTYIDNQPVNLGSEILLSAAEIHLIDCIGNHPDDTITRIATRLGVTKGAISQMVSRLEQKGYLSRCCMEGNKKSFTFTLTETGEKAFLWHLTLHERINSRMLKGIDLTSDEGERFLNLLTNICRTLDYSLEVRDSHTRDFLKKYREQEEEGRSPGTVDAK